MASHSELTPAAMRLSGLYNWKGQAERLVYLGAVWMQRRRWHQFALITCTHKVWCEVPDEDLGRFEESMDVEWRDDANGLTRSPHLAPAHADMPKIERTADALHHPRTALKSQLFGMRYGGPVKPRPGFNGAGDVHMPVDPEWMRAVGRSRRPAPALLYNRGPRPIGALLEDLAAKAVKPAPRLNLAEVAWAAVLGGWGDGRAAVTIRTFGDGRRPEVTVVQPLPDLDRNPAHYDWALRAAAELTRKGAEVPLHNTPKATVASVVSGLEYTHAIADEADSVRPGGCVDEGCPHYQTPGYCVPRPGGCTFHSDPKQLGDTWDAFKPGRDL